MNAKQEVLAKVEESIRQIEAKLSACVLDGTPMLVIIERNGLEMVYGDWETGRGFKPACVIANHLCGTFQFSPESAQRNTAALRAKGEKAYYIHWRAFLQNRLAEEQKMVALFN